MANEYFLTARVSGLLGRTAVGQAMISLGNTLLGWDQVPPIPVTVQVDSIGGLHLSSAKRGATINVTMEGVDEKDHDVEQKLGPITDSQGVDLPQGLKTRQQLIIKEGKATVRIYP